MQVLVITKKKDKNNYREQCLFLFSTYPSPFPIPIYIEALCDIVDFLDPKS